MRASSAKAIPSATTPFLFDKDDASPVYCLMHQSFSNDCQRNYVAEDTAVPKLTAPDFEENHTTPPFTLTSRRSWGSDQEARDKPLHWQRVILIQDGTDSGFIQALIRTGQDSTRTNDVEEYKGHVLEVLIEVNPTDLVGNVIHKLLLKCYSQPETIPAPHTLRYTLGKLPSNLVWRQSSYECNHRDRNVPVPRRQT